MDYDNSRTDLDRIKREGYVANARYQRQDLFIALRIQAPWSIIFVHFTIVRKTFNGKSNDKQICLSALLQDSDLL
jgi:hypothetical protein